MAYNCVPSDGKLGGLVSLRDPSVFQVTNTIKDQYFLLVIGLPRGSNVSYKVMNVYALKTEP